MTSEPDSKPGRRPPTIELTATEVDKPASPMGAGATEPPRTGEAEPTAKRANGAAGGRLKSHVISACIGAIATAAIVGGLWLAGFAPLRQAAAPLDAAAPQSGNADDISARLDKIEGAIKAQLPGPASGNRLAAEEAQTKSLGDSLAALSRRVDDVAGTAQTARVEADAASAAADTVKGAAPSAVQRSDIDALTSRIASLESAVKALSDNAVRPASSADDRAARFAIAAEALRAAVERGVSYQAELAAAKSLGADQNATAPLDPFAAPGLPSATALAQELAKLTPAMQRAADAAPDETNFLGRLEANAQKLVRITPLDAPAGNDPSAVIARIRLDAGRADIAAALTAIAALPDAAKSLGADWVKKAEARDIAVAAGRQIAADALAALGKPASQ